MRSQAVRCLKEQEVSAVGVAIVAAEPAGHDFRGELVTVAVEHVLELDAEAAELALDEGGAVLRAVPHMDYVDAIDIEDCRRGGGIRH